MERLEWLKASVTVDTKEEPSMLTSSPSIGLRSVAVVEQH